MTNNDDDDGVDFDGDNDNDDDDDDDDDDGDDDDDDVDDDAGSLVVFSMVSGARPRAVAYEKSLNQLSIFSIFVMTPIPNNGKGQGSATRGWRLAVRDGGAMALPEDGALETR